LQDEPALQDKSFVGVQGAVFQKSPLPAGGSIFPAISFRNLAAAIAKKLAWHLIPNPFIRRRLKWSIVGA